MDTWLQKYIVNPRLVTLYIIYHLSISFVTVLPLFYDGSPIITKVVVPTYYLVLREFLFMSIMGGFVVLTSAWSALLTASILFLLLSLTVAVVTGIDSFYLMGIKSLLPVVFLFLWPAKNRQVVSLQQFSWTKTIKGILLVNLFFQTLHLFFGAGYYAKLAIGLNARNPGLLYYPAATAIFILVLFAAYLKENKKTEIGWISLFVLSIFMCSSLTGIIGLLLLLVHRFYLSFDKRNFRKVLLISILVFPGLLFLHFARSSMNGPIYYLESSTARLNIFKKAISTIQLLPQKFGYFTNIAAQGEKGFMPDSFYTAFMGNLGIIWSVIMGLFLIYGFISNAQAKQDPLFISLFLIGSFSMNMTETGVTMLLIVLFKSRYAESHTKGRSLYVNNAA